jgi:hypothetical protein
MAQALSSADVTSVLVTVSAADMQPRTAELVKTNNQWGGTIGNLPAGTNRTFTAEAFNNGGTKLYSGVATGVTILARQMTAISITLQEVNPPAPFANAAPVVASLSAAPGTVEPGGTVTLNASASDANADDTLTYAWSAPSGTFAQPSNLSTTWTAPSSPATVPLTLTVTDSKGAQAKVTFNVNVTSGRGDAAVNTSLNTWPQVGNISASATSLAVNESTTVSSTASDNDGDTLAYNWTASCPGTWANATSATATFTATALPSSNTCNNCNLTVTVTDLRNGRPMGGQTTGTFSLCVGPKKTATFPPDITETFQSVASTSASGTVTFQVKAVDPQGSAMSFTWTTSAGTLGSPTTGADASRVVWTAPACVAADPTITATVTNALNASASHTFKVTGVQQCTYTLSSCGQTGRQGPAQSQCDTSYSSTGLAGKVTVQSGYQRWTVPSSGTYRITARGAQGGTTATNSRGLGAEMQGEFSLTAGEELIIVVGQAGTDKPGCNDWGAGGGGGTFVTRKVSSGGDVLVPLGINVSPLIIAAGGGGSPDGEWVTGGTCNVGMPAPHGRSSTGGADTGGTVGSGIMSGAGGGYRTSGAAGIGGYGGSAFLNGALGGLASANYPGGFGGGGAPYNEGGGGGGYTGGGVPNRDVAEGGMSFNAGSNPTGTAGVRTGHGQVSITRI